MCYVKLHKRGTSHSRDLKKESSLPQCDEGRCGRECPRRKQRNSERVYWQRELCKQSVGVGKPQPRPLGPSQQELLPQELKGTSATETQTGIEGLLQRRRELPSEDVTGQKWLTVGALTKCSLLLPLTSTRVPHRPGELSTQPPQQPETQGRANGERKMEDNWNKRFYQGGSVRPEIREMSQQRIGGSSR